MLTIISLYCSQLFVNLLYREKINLCATLPNFFNNCAALFISKDLFQAVIGPPFLLKAGAHPQNLPNRAVLDRFQRFERLGWVDQILKIAVKDTCIFDYIEHRFGFSYVASPTASYTGWLCQLRQPSQQLPDADCWEDRCRSHEHSDESEPIGIPRIGTSRFNPPRQLCGAVAIPIHPDSSGLRSESRFR